MPQNHVGVIIFWSFACLLLPYCQENPIRRIGNQSHISQKSQQGVKFSITFGHLFQLEPLKNLIISRGRYWVFSRSLYQGSLQLYCTHVIFTIFDTRLDINISSNTTYRLKLWHFHWLGPLGRVSLVVTMSMYLYVPSPCNLFSGLLLALRSHD